MNTIKPFKGKFCNKECTIYAINSKDVNTGLTTVFKCPYCKEAHLYNVKFPKKEVETERYCIAVYDVVCATCNKEFEILDICEKLED